MPNDYDFANQIWNQIGISVLSTGIENVDFSKGNAAGNPVVQATINPADRTNIQSKNRQDDPIINNWYGTSGVSGSGRVLRGVTRRPSVSATDGTMIFNNAANDTFAHELGHFLLDPHRFANGSATSQGHSAMDTDLMASGSLPRKTPSNNQKGMGNSAPKDPGLRPIGNLGTVDHFDEPLKLNGMGADIEQIEAAHRSPFIQRDDNGLTHGDCADFDWVEDHIPLETTAPSGDNHDGVDFMVWEIGPIACSSHLWEHPTNSALNIAHDHDDWGELILPAFTDESFNVVDVVSQIARYTDMDVDDSGEWSARNSALDYDLWFSMDNTNWTMGNPIKVFEEGWTDKSKADNWVARWLSPFDANFVQIAADPSVSNHDRNTQIDAIIAAQITIPEPSSVFSIFAFGGLGLMKLRKKRQ